MINATPSAWTFGSAGAQLLRSVVARQEEQEEAEWKAIEAEHETAPRWGKNPDGSVSVVGYLLVAPKASLKDVQPSFRNVPHPKSYGADLPMWSNSTDLTKTTKAERAILAKRPVMVTQRRDVMELAFKAAGVNLVNKTTHTWLDQRRTVVEEEQRIPFSSTTQERDARDIDKARTAILKRRQAVRNRATELSFNFAIVEG